MSTIKIISGVLALVLTCANPSARAQGNIDFSKAQVVASKPTKDFDQGRMGGAITPDRFVSLVYTDLARKEKQTR